MIGRFQGASLVLGSIAVASLVATGGVLSRGYDGGIFLSTSAGLVRGLPLYSGVWDNKDPLFYAASAGATAIMPVMAFVMDWIWIPLAGLGAFLIARRVVPMPMALMIATIVTPLLIVGPLYEPGLTSAPGTALALLCLGVLMNRWFLLAGIGIGLLIFLKIMLVPGVLLCALAALITLRERGAWVRLAAGLAGTVAGGIVVMLLLGWLRGYAGMLQRNAEYSSTVMTYFGYEPSWWGHLSKFTRESGAGTSMMSISAGIFLAAVVLVLIRRHAVTREQIVAVAWLGACLVGIGLLLALSYVWRHHAMAVSLVSVIAVIAIVGLVPWRPLAWTTLLATAVLVSGWTSVGHFVEHIGYRFSEWAAATLEISEYPRDARLLNTVPMSRFTYARLGSNDDRGFLASVRSGAELACPDFHAYDFSPTETFSRLYECVGTVDVVLVTDSFEEFARGVNAGNARPILDYVDNSFGCIRLDDRRICTRVAALLGDLKGA